MATVLTDNQHYSDIASAIRAKGVSGTFLPSEMAAAIANIPSGSQIYHTSGDLDYRNYQAPCVVTIPYTRTEQNIIVLGRCVGVWYTDADGVWQLSTANDFTLTTLAQSTTFDLRYILLSPSLALPAVSLKTKAGSSVTYNKVHGWFDSINANSGTSAAATSARNGNAMTISGTQIKQTLNNGHFFARAGYGTRFHYELYAW